MIAPSSPTRQQVCKIVYFSSRCKQLWIFILQVTVLRLVPIPRSCLTCDPLSGYSTSSISLGVIGICKPLYRDKLETINREIVHNFWYTLIMSSRLESLLNFQSAIHLSSSHQSPHHGGNNIHKHSKLTKKKLIQFFTEYTHFIGLNVCRNSIIFIP